MAASNASAAPDLPRNKRYRFLRQLNSRPVPTYVGQVILPSGPGPLVIVERLERGKHLSVDAALGLARRMRAIAEIRTPALASIKEVLIGENDVLIVSELIDGQVLHDLLKGDESFPAGALVRAVLDALEGLAALHSAVDSRKNPLNLIHGALSPHDIIVGIDGRSRLVNLSHAPSLPIPTNASAYLAPELTQQVPELDQRADVFSIGAILWQGLTGESPNLSELDEPVLLLDLPPWAEDLVPIARRALSEQPADRFPSAGELSEALKRAVGEHLADYPSIAQLVGVAAGAIIDQRKSLDSIEVPEGLFPPTAPPVLVGEPRAVGGPDPYQKKAEIKVETKPFPSRASEKPQTRPASKGASEKPQDKPGLKPLIKAAPSENPPLKPDLKSEPANGAGLEAGTSPTPAAFDLPPPVDFQVEPLAPERISTATSAPPVTSTEQQTDAKQPEAKLEELEELSPEAERAASFPGEASPLFNASGVDGLTPTVRPEKSNRRLLLIGAAGAGLLLCATIVWLFWRGKGDSNAQTASTQGPAVPTEASAVTQAPKEQPTAGSASSASPDESAAGDSSAASSDSAAPDDSGTGSGAPWKQFEDDNSSKSKNKPRTYEPMGI